MHLDEAEIRKVAEPMMDDIMLGIFQRNYQIHSKHFSVKLKSSLGPEDFLQDCDQRESEWGRPRQQRELIAIARKEKSFTLLWNQPFDSTEGEVFALVTVALKGGRYFVDYFLLH
ncbi:MAG: hypothetical protein AB8B63_07255 [Granulosicoccus sp.]